MKKTVMMLGLIMGIAFVSNASTVNWAISDAGAGWNIVDKDNSAFTGGTAFLYALTGVSSTPSHDGSSWNMSGALLVAAASYSADISGSGYAGYGDLSTTLTSANAVGQETMTQYYAWILTDQTGITKLDDLTAGAWYAIVGVAIPGSSAESTVEPITYSVDAYWLNGNTAGQWTEVVPEPTSMALLALGAAVIGMRRKFKK